MDTPARRTGGYLFYRQPTGGNTYIYRQYAHRRQKAGMLEVRWTGEITADIPYETKRPYVRKRTTLTLRTYRTRVRRSSTR